MLLFKRYEYNPQTDVAGRGAFSRVYKAVDTTNGKTVAVKMYRIDALSDHYRAVQNAQAILTIDHPGLCNYVAIEEIEKEDAFGEIEKLQVCIAAFMNAGTLANYHQAHNETGVLKTLVLNVLNGLSVLHKKGIIHGSIKPSNVLVTETANGAVAGLTDFAMGISFAESLQGIGTAALLTSSYLSPEQINPAAYGVGGKISFNTDIWSFALVLYEVLTGDVLLPGTAADFPETIAGRMSAFELPAKIGSLPPPFQQFLTLALKKDAGLRAQTVDELLPLLEATIPPVATGVMPEELPEIQPPISQLKNGEEQHDEIEEADVTRVIVPPKKEYSKSAQLDAGKERDDHTRVIAKPVATDPARQESAEEDETKSIPPSAAANQPDTEELADADATRLIKKPVETTDGHFFIENIAAADEADTKVIAKPAQSNTLQSKKPAEEHSTPARSIHTNETANDGSEDDTKVLTAVPSAATGDTIVLSTTNKEKTGADARGQDQTRNKKVPAAGKEDDPAAIIIKRRDKPVVLFNRYEYAPSGDLIGKGGFSRVYKAYDKRLSRWVALKIYKTGEFSDRYSPIAEIKRVVNLDHPNICRYLDIEEIENENPFGENEKIQVCVMELLDSGNFADYYKANKNPETLKKLIQDILNGLSYLHKNGIIHRDIKPANILIKQTIDGPVAKITDFGISKKSDTDNNNSSSALIVSIPYMAPEQLNAKRYGINENISYNLDLWSLGVTIYEVITGKVLFKNTDQDNSEQIMANIMAPELPAKLNDLPEPFKNIVSHCVIKNARERASRAEELMVLLNSTATPASNAVVMGSQAANTISEIKKESLISTETGDPQKSEAGSSSVDPRIHKSKNAGFAIGGANEEQPIIDENNNNRALYLFIAAAIAAFVVFVIFLKTGSQPVPAGGTVVVIKDSVVKASSIVAPPDTTQAGAVVVPKKQDTTVTVSQPSEATENTTGKNKREVHRKPAQHNEHTEKVAATGTATKYVLLLYSETDCNLKVNSISYGEIQKGNHPLRIYLAAGRYVLQFTSSSNSASTYTANIAVTAENLGHADKFRIPLN